MRILFLISKIVVFAFVVTSITLIFRFLNPELMNEMAMAQMSSTVDSSFWIGIFSHISNYSWVVIAAITVMTFREELTYITKFLKRKFKEEKNND